VRLVPSEAREFDEATSKLAAISLQLHTDCFFIFALSFCLLIFEFCFSEIAMPEARNDRVIP